MLDTDKYTDIYQSLFSNPTKYEQILIDKLNIWNIEYVFQYPFEFETYCYFADFYFKKYKCYLEIDGKNHNYQKEYDLNRKNAIYKCYGITEIRLTNDEITTLSKDKLLNMLKTSSKVTHHKKKNRRNHLPKYGSLEYLITERNKRKKLLNK